MRNPRVVEQRHGFALLTVLATLVTAAGLAAALQWSARDTLAAARNRIAYRAARWHAEDCLSRLRAVYDGGSGEPTPGWMHLDSVVSASMTIKRAAGCQLHVRAAGATLEVNALDSANLKKALIVLGTGSTLADSLVDALLDWRDADDMERPQGAEAGWYAKRSSRVPTDGDVATRAELGFIRGMERVTDWDSVFSTDSGRVCLSHASDLVLQLLPGSSTELVTEIRQRRSAGTLTGDPAQLGIRLSEKAAALLAMNADRFAARVTAVPDAWIVESRGISRTSPVAVTVEVRLAREGQGTVVQRRREWFD